MLTGLPPFYCEDVQQMYTKIMTADLSFPDVISDTARDLLSKVRVDSNFYVVNGTNVLSSYWSVNLLVVWLIQHRSRHIRSMLALTGSSWRTWSWSLHSNHKSKTIWTSLTSTLCSPMNQSPWMMTKKRKTVKTAMFLTTAILIGTASLTILPMQRRNRVVLWF